MNTFHPLRCLATRPLCLAAGVLVSLAGCAVPYAADPPTEVQAPRYQGHSPAQYRVEPLAQPGFERRDYRRRNNERLYEVNITSVRAVVGPPQQRCWMEREQVSGRSSAPNMPGALAGAVIGGILGHQIGGGTGRDWATAGGVVAGAVVGSSLGRDRNGQPIQTHDVQRCSHAPAQTQPDYWDVTYSFRGRQHRVQLSDAPGRTLIVNQDGEPRI